MKVRDADALSADFARNRPDSFAQVLRAADASSIRAVLNELPPALPASVMARLPVPLILEVLEGSSEDVPEWLEEAPFDDAALLISRLPQHISSEQLSRVKSQRRRIRLKQYLNYPPHSLGALVSQPALVLSASTSLDEILAKLRDVAGEAFHGVVVLGEQNRYAGMLDPWHLLARGNSAAPAGDFVRAVPVLRPEMAAFSALSDSAWESHSRLPVVDHEGRFLGMIEYIDLLDVAPPESPREVRVLAALTEGFVRSCAALLRNTLTARPRA